MKEKEEIAGVQYYNIADKYCSNIQFFVIISPRMYRDIFVI